MTANQTLRNTSMVTLLDVLTGLEKEGAALGHFNVSDQVLLKAVIAAAVETKLPVLVGASEGERGFFGARQLAALVKSLRQESNLPVFLNADHTHSIETAMEAATAGFDAVGIDFSALPFEENVARTSGSSDQGSQPRNPCGRGNRRHRDRFRNPRNRSGRLQEADHTSGSATIRRGDRD